MQEAGEIQTASYFLLERSERWRAMRAVRQINTVYSRGVDGSYYILEVIEKMRKFVKFVAIIVAGIVLVLALGSAIAVGERTYGYMTRQNFSFGKAWEWAVQDYNDWLFNDVLRKEETKETVLEFPIANWNIEVTACTSH